MRFIKLTASSDGVSVYINTKYIIGLFKGKDGTEISTPEAINGENWIVKESVEQVLEKLSDSKLVSEWIV